MAAITNPYDSLYTNLKNRFTVIYDGSECTVGDYMLAKAGKKQNAASSLAIRTTVSRTPALTTFAKYVNDKLTLKSAPEKNKTMRRFPLRTSASSVFSAVAACALVFSFGILTLKSAPVTAPYTADASEVEAYTPAEDTIDELVKIEK